MLFKAGVKGLSENIEVRSLIGRFLEHSRIFYYYNDGREDLFLSSADWMPRNLNRRVEILFPVLDESCRQRVLEVLNLQLQDTERARIMLGDASYQRFRLLMMIKACDSQKTLMELAIDASQKMKQNTYGQNRYEPQKSPER